MIFVKGDMQMNDMKMLVWIFPILFILHDMEEIVFQKAWKIKKKKLIGEGIAGKFLGAKSNSTAAFSMAVYEELIITIIVSLIGVYTNHYELWYGFLWANTIHLVAVHIIGGTVVFKSYTPGVVSAVICLLPCIYIIYRSIMILNYSVFMQIIYIVVMTIVTMINLKMLHNNMQRFEKIIYYRK